MSDNPFIIKIGPVAWGLGLFMYVSLPDGSGWGHAFAGIYIRTKRAR